MKYTVAFLGGFLLILLECGFLPKLFGISFSLAFAWCLAFGLQSSAVTGAACGIFCGLMMDILVGPRIGYYAFSYLIAVSIAGGYYHHVLQEGLLFAGICSLGGYLLLELMQYGFALFLGGRTENVALIFLRYMLPSALVTGVLTLPMHWLVGALFRTRLLRSVSLRKTD